jgi:hypothetical protein
LLVANIIGPYQQEQQEQQEQKSRKQEQKTRAENKSIKQDHKTRAEKAPPPSEIPMSLPDFVDEGYPWGRGHPSGVPWPGATSNQ